VSEEEANMKLNARNTILQLLTLYTDPECHNTLRFTWTDRRTDRQMISWCQKPIILC